MATSHSTPFSHHRFPSLPRRRLRSQHRRAESQRPENAWWVNKGPAIVAGCRLSTDRESTKPDLHPESEKTRMVTWWFIPLSKWVITPLITGISRVNPLPTSSNWGELTHLGSVGWTTKQWVWVLFHGSNFDTTTAGFSLMTPVRQS